ncbi:MAG: hypothetical protein IJR68_00525, partial [Fretibacterium sp.]|nr:hypothetical protein [Fretibacterium sp.]
KLHALLLSFMMFVLCTARMVTRYPDGLGHTFKFYPSFYGYTSVKCLFSKQNAVAFLKKI